MLAWRDCRKLWYLLTLSIVLGGVSFFLGGCSSPPPRQQTIEVRLGVPLQPSSALLFVALQNKLFSRHGLDVEVITYPSGKRALHEGLFGGQVDVVGSAGLPVALAALQRQDFRIIASTCAASDVNSIIARQDLGVKEAADLAGKRLATQQGSAVHYFLHLFLQQHGLSDKAMELSFLKAEELPQALAQGEIDAFSMRAPFIDQARQLLAGQTVEFRAPGLYEQQELLLVAADFATAHPQVNQRLLAALLEAEELVEQDGDQLVQAGQRFLQQDVGPLFKAFTFRVQLDQSLIMRLEDKARWAISSQLSPPTAIPNFLTLIDQTGLQVLRPAAVLIY